MTGAWPLRPLAGLALGFLLGLVLLHAVPFDPTSELPAVASKPDLRQQLAGVSQKKAAGEFRVFSVGASLSSGYPYKPILEASFGTLLGVGLDAVHPDRRILGRPVAKPALDSPRLVELVDELFAYQPDLLIVTLGSNEYANRLFSSKRIVPKDWLGWLREHGGRGRVLFDAQPLDGLRFPKSDQMPREEEALARRLVAKALDAKPGEAQLGGLPFLPEERELLLGRLRRSMRAIDAACRARKVPVVFCMAVYGLGDFWPWGMAEDGLDPEVDSLVWRYRDGADRGALRKDVDAALRTKARRADLWFLHAKLLQADGKSREARQAFVKARDLDPVPIHRTSAIEQTIREEARALGRLVLDLDQPFRERAADGIEGRRYYLDYGHLTEEGHRIAAEWLAARLSERGLVPSLGGRWRERFRGATAAYLDAKLIPAERRIAAARMALANGNFSLLFGNFREALPYLEKAFATLPQDDDLAVRIVFCLAMLSGKQESFGRGKAAGELIQRVWGQLKQAVQDGKLPELVMRMRKGDFGR